MPLAMEVLERRCGSAGAWAMARQDLLEELPKTKLGPALEIDVVAARCRFEPSQILHIKHLSSRLCVLLGLTCGSLNASNIRAYG